jgi:hypothetical protein
MDRPMSRYAEGTKVTVESSRGEITGILAKHGVSRMGWSSEPNGDTLMFALGGYNFRFDIARPTLDDVRKLYPNAYDWAPKVDMEWRRRWRANVLLLKAKLEFIDSGDTTLIRELLPYAVLKSGRTLEEEIGVGNLLQLQAGS